MSGKPATDPARSALMKRVRQARTAPENAVAALLRAQGVTYRRNVRSLPGSPDFANVARGFAIFVNGCFWHAHRNCKRPHSRTPKQNAAFWQAKFAANRARDARKIRALRAMGLRVMLVWECELRDEGKLAGRLARLKARLITPPGSRASHKARSSR